MSEAGSNSFIFYEPSGRWEVNTKGGPDEPHFEISVIRAGNEHGKRSYGWFDDYKFLISHNGGNCPWPVTKRVWDKLVLLAWDVANELNALESKPKQ